MHQGRDYDEQFSAFVRARREQHLRLAVLIAADWQSGEDLLQASLLKLYRAWPRLDTSTNPDWYLRRIILNTYRSWWRTQWRRETPAAPHAAGAESHISAASQVALDSGAMREGDDFADRQVVGLLVREALAKLPRQQRAVLVLRYFAGLPEAEIASVLGCSRGSVKSHAHRGLHALRGLLGDEWPRRVVSQGPSAEAGRD